MQLKAMFQLSGVFGVSCALAACGAETIEPQQGGADAGGGSGTGGTGTEDPGAGGTEDPGAGGTSTGGTNRGEPSNRQASPNPPGGLSATDIPMFVTLGFDDNGYSGCPAPRAKAE